MVFKIEFFKFPNTREVSLTTPTRYILIRSLTIRCRKQIKWAITLLSLYLITPRRNYRYQPPWMIIANWGAPQWP
jgi:hypothetical protein